MKTLLLTLVALALVATALYIFGDGSVLDGYTQTREQLS